MKILENVSLEKKTTFGMGSYAKYWVNYQTEEDFEIFLDFIQSKKIPFFILGDGSNTIFLKEIFEGIIIHPVNNRILIQLNHKDFIYELPASIEYYKEKYDLIPDLNLLSAVEESYKMNKKIQIYADAGINWDIFVYFCIIHGIGGLESLSGIPGKIGASPVQNISAYGEEIKNFIKEIRVFEISNHRVRNTKILENQDCNFSYRSSIFKRNLLKYFITNIKFESTINYEPLPKYKEITKKYYEILKTLDSIQLPDIYDNFSREFQEKIKKMLLLRRIIITTRRVKGMFLDESEEFNKTAGSFFMNPILNEQEWNKAKQKIVQNLDIDESEIPFYIENGYIKIPAAWLIEKSGFIKGYKYKHLGISQKHSLAIINFGANEKDLKEFIEYIQYSVLQNTGFFLKPEVVLVP